MFFSDNDTVFIAQVKDFIPASAATTRTRLWPFIDQAERKYLLPILGTDTYSDLKSYADDPDAWEVGESQLPTADNSMGTVDDSIGTADTSTGSADTVDGEKMAELLRLVRLSVINLAYYLGFNLLNAKLSDMGFQRMESESSKGLYKYQEENVKVHFRDTGLNGIDDILLYLEENIEYFPEWEESSAYTLRKSSIIKDTTTFNSICDISGSRLIFLRLQPFVQQVLDIDIKSLLGSTVYTALITELAKADPDGSYEALAVEIRKPLAFLSVALMVMNTGTLTDKGFYFEGKNSGFPDNTTINPATGEGRSSVYSYYKTTGEHYLEALRKYLTDNSFTGYTATTGNVYNRDNEDKKTFWAT